MSCILAETGKCIDVEALSNICKGCAKWESKDKTSQEYLRWNENHACKMNHGGSAASMETVGIVRMFVCLKGPFSLVDYGIPNFSVMGILLLSRKLLNINHTEKLLFENWNVLATCKRDVVHAFVG